MKWINLKKNLCPKCGSDLSEHYNAATDMLECPCGFKITQQKFIRIVNSQVNAQVEAQLNKEYEEENE